MEGDGPEEEVQYGAEESMDDILEEEMEYGPEEEEVAYGPEEEEVAYGQEVVAYGQEEEEVEGLEEEEEEELEVVFVKSPTQQSNFNVYDFFICKLDYFTIY